MKHNLTLKDMESPTWKKVEASMREELDEARRKLESQALDDKPIQTARLRERIVVLNAYLQIPEQLRAAARPADPPKFFHDPEAGL